MRSALMVSIAALVAAALMGALGCGGGSERDADSEEDPVVLESGSTEPNPDYFVTADGEIVYEDSRTGSEQDGPGADTVLNLPPVFPGAQRIHPANEDPKERESYLTRAPIEAVEQFYRDILAAGEGNGDDGEEEEATDEVFVNRISSEDESGRRQAALFVNEGDGLTGGMKVMLKEFPAQHAVQIVLTTLSATPPGIDPIGVYVTPEEVAEWADEREAQREETERQRADAETRATEPHEDNESLAEEAG